ncbi:hypothetical protein OQJ18_13675 [Fluoribacter dumoffii]|uniref:hypothetical protein n=1 Tax=Fluoribacter dumoffii TaxID=463 RepID=UPI0022442E9B|nr:hypothetical protein [Fluoribacter dumoffii]MCW8387601.1 hypothetical protein [Fluoribacter dumoffii]MCW8416854.1 hypothetical protein [Fluoribacter dumoffii]MCW8455306.1 hypothetical protein [Fluoribacter dumoffii]MCW8484097.1 hypothetical protein [Fluoribacter dumoffii]MCW8497804.1 hypothetical protein [Fluoribacter dumoffii]
MLTSKRTLLLSAMAVFLSANSNLFACQCFNSFFLNSIFSNNPGMSCSLSTNYGRVVRVSLSDGRNSAVSSIYGCSLHSVSSNIQRDFDYYTNDNELCVEEILNACRMLNIEIQSDNGGAYY